MENITAAILPSASFFCREGASDKEYNMQVSEVDHGYVVKYQYGRRGATLTPGVKPAKPVALDLAMKQFERMCKERITKGYTQAGTSTAAIETVERSRSGLQPQLLNQIDDEALEASLQDPAMCMQQKEDGERIMVSCRVSNVMASNKLGFTRPLPQSVIDAILSLPCHEVVLDGELVGAQFRVFDMLSLNGNCYRAHGYGDRYAKYLAFLSMFQSPALSLVEGWFEQDDKRKHFKRIKLENGEGVVFKDIHARSSPGRPNSGGAQLKFKFTESVTCIVDRVSDLRRSISLALLDERGIPALVGNVTVPVNKIIPAVGDLVEVRYLYRYENGSLFQPVLLGARTDIALHECTLSQIHRIKTKTSIFADDE